MSVFNDGSHIFQRLIGLRVMNSNECNLAMNTIYLKVVDKSQTQLAYDIFPRFVREERWFGRSFPFVSGYN
ncbi:hypothetical protein [Nitrososphaera sp. AFS]|uniref:hypothetical protein n=1 Tax=Nitrososphaera sp. AFS TaxID=2301191 RepID=UPI00139228A9|nr:hypothetical protein [Nitrososphaera sp. AFS]NAL78763.1 hypothetical protein [Nitrososphaera sp. AFS]